MNDPTAVISKTLTFLPFRYCDCDSVPLDVPLQLNLLKRILFPFVL